MILLVLGNGGYVVLESDDVALITWHNGELKEEVRYYHNIGQQENEEQV